MAEREGRGLALAKTTKKLRIIAGQYCGAGCPFLAVDLHSYIVCRRYGSASLSARRYCCRDANCIDDTTDTFISTEEKAKALDLDFGLTVTEDAYKARVEVQAGSVGLCGAGCPYLLVNRGVVPSCSLYKVQPARYVRLEDRAPNLEPTNVPNYLLRPNECLLDSTVPLVQASLEAAVRLPAAESSPNSGPRVVYRKRDYLGGYDFCNSTCPYRYSRFPLRGTGCLRYSMLLQESGTELRRCENCLVDKTMETVYLVDEKPTTLREAVISTPPPRYTKNSTQSQVKEPAKAVRLSPPPLVPYIRLDLSEDEEEED